MRVPSFRLVPVLFAVVVLAGGCGDETGAGDPTGKTSSTSTAVPAPADIRYDRAGEVKELGPGTVVGVSGDGTTAYVAADNPDPEVLGCEGARAPQLYAAPLDGSPRTIATPPDTRPLSGEVLRHPEGSKVAVVDQCEGFFSRLATATERPGGQLTDVTFLDEKLVEGLGYRASWSADGRSLITTTSEEARDVLRIELGSGRRTTLLAGRRAIHAAELADGSLAALLPEGLLLGGEPVAAQGFGLSVAPDGRQLVVHGEQGLFLVRADRSVTELADGSVAQATWSPDGKAIAYMTDARIHVVTLDGAKSHEAESHEIVAKAPFSPAYFTPDGRALLFTLAKTSAPGIEEPVVGIVHFS